MQSGEMSPILNNLHSSGRLVKAAVFAKPGQEFRNIARPTNVLAFPSTGLEEIFPEFLGDIVVCGPRVTEEAAEQGKSVEAHWAHLVVHGALHLLGYDHIETDDAARMEELERKLLAGLGFPDPYAQ